MNFVRALRAEFQKLYTLPSVWLGLAITIAGSAVITWISASQSQPPTAQDGHYPSLENAFTGIPILGLAGMLVIAILAIGSEYAVDEPDAGGSRQISTTLGAAPGRTRVIVAKAVTITVTTLVAAAITIPLNIAFAQSLAGPGAAVAPLDVVLPRAIGTAWYWLCMALIAFAVTVFTRSSAFPLLFFIANSSLVSVTFLLTRVTKLADWLPDMAGRNLFGFPPRLIDPGGLDPEIGWIVMGAWAAGALIAAAITFIRRDA